MLFNSLEFLIFLPLVFIGYWTLQKNLKVQNLFICLASYIFYGWWDYKFLFLIILTTFLSYISGILIDKYRQKGCVAKFVNVSNIIVNLLILCIFKYYNFFSQSLADALSAFGITVDWVTLDIILPVGISFYTFQALSYSIDVYRKEIPACKDPIAFFAFIAFFPQLVAGPIERAGNLLVQMQGKRSFEYSQAIDGCKQIAWGFFKKIVVADTAATIVDAVYSDIVYYNPTALFISAVFFSFQIYGDFSGYSDIAIGVAKLFGIRLIKNFDLPYFSRNIPEFWKRWHISLNKWFISYLYIPLGGSRKGLKRTFINTLTVFLASGLWHGANWTFVIWGLYHSILFIPNILIKSKNKIIPDATIRFKEIGGIIITFVLTTIGWIIFRSANIHEACAYIYKLFEFKNYALPNFNDVQLRTAAECIFGIIILIAIEWYNRNETETYRLAGRCSIARWIIYITLILWSFIFFKTNQTFIYFQF